MDGPRLARAGGRPGLSSPVHRPPGWMARHRVSQALRLQERRRRDTLATGTVAGATRSMACNGPVLRRGPGDAGNRRDRHGGELCADLRPLRYWRDSGRIPTSDDPHVRRRCAGLLPVCDVRRRHPQRRSDGGVGREQNRVFDSGAGSQPGAARLARRRSHLEPDRATQRARSGRLLRRVELVVDRVGKVVDQLRRGHDLDALSQRRGAAAAAWIAPGARFQARLVRRNGRHRSGARDDTGRRGSLGGDRPADGQRTQPDQPRSRGDAAGQAFT